MGKYKDLKPCPFCGSREITVHAQNHFHACSECSATGPVRTRVLTAQAAWNRRADEAVLDALRGLLAEPYGCSLCDSGTLRDPAKGHQPDCPYEKARDVLESYNPF